MTMRRTTIYFLLIFYLAFNSKNYGQGEMYQYNYPLPTPIFTIEGNNILSNDGNTFFWKTADGSGKTISSITIKEPLSTNGKTRIAQSSDGKYLILAGQKGVALIDGKKRKQIDFFPYRYRNEHLFVGFTGDKSFVVFDPNYYSYSIDSNNKIISNQQLEIKANKTISPNCKWMVQMDYKNSTSRDVMVWDLQNGKKASEFNYQFPKGQYPNLLGIDNSGTFIVFEEYQTNTNLKVLNRLTKKASLLKSFPPIVQNTVIGTSTSNFKLHVDPTQPPKHIFGHSPGHFYYFDSGPKNTVSDNRLILLNLNTQKEAGTYAYAKNHAPTAFSPDETSCIFSNQIIDLKSGIALGPTANTPKLMPIPGTDNAPYFFDENRIVYGGLDWINVFDIGKLTASGSTWTTNKQWIFMGRANPRLNLVPQKSSKSLIFSSTGGFLFEWFPATLEFKELMLGDKARVEKVLPCPGSDLLFVFGNFPEDDPRYIKMIEGVMDNIRPQFPTIPEGVSDEVKQRLDSLKQMMLRVQEGLIEEHGPPPTGNILNLDSLFDRTASNITNDPAGTLKQAAGSNPRKDKIVILDPASMKIVGELKSWQSTHGLEDSQAMTNKGGVRLARKIKSAAKRPKPLEILVDLELASMLFTPDGKYLYTEINASENRIQPHSGAIIKWGIENNQVRQLKTLFIFGEGRKKRNNPVYSTLSISKDGSKLIHTTVDGEIKIWSTSTDKLLHQFESADHIFNFATLNAKQNRLIALTSEQEVQMYSFPQFKLLESEKDAAFSRIEYLEFSPDESMILASRSGATAIYKTDGFEKLLTFQSLSRKSGGFVAQTPDGYYVSSRGLNEKPPFEEAESSSFSFAQHDLIYNRPDIILSRIPGSDPNLVKLYQKMYKTRLDHLGISNDLELEELLSGSKIAVSVDNVPNSTDQKNITVNVKVDIKDIMVERLVVLANDVPLPIGKEFISAPVSNTTIEKELQIELGNGNNTLSFFAVTKDGIESSRKIFNCTYTGKMQKPDLYLIAIGISKYESLSQLDFASKDAKDIIDLFSNQNQAHYGKIHQKLFLDGAFNTKSLKEIREFIKDSKVDDHILFYYAGHGLNKDGDFYLTTSKSLSGKGFQNFFSFKDLETLFDQNPTRNRLILIDACYSGEVAPNAEKDIKDDNTTIEESTIFRTANTNGGAVVSQEDREIMKRFFVDLRFTSGTNIIAATQGDQRAGENKELGNGVFTYFIIKGIKNKAADSDFQGEVSVEELTNYIFTEVPKYAKEKKYEQQPTFRVEVLNNKWPVYNYD